MEEIFDEKITILTNIERYLADCEIRTRDIILKWLSLVPIQEND